MAKNYYFTRDGAYGEAIDGCIIDTTHWTDSDWDEIETVSDWDRVNIARYITEGRGGQVSDMVPGPWVTIRPDGSTHATLNVQVYG